MLRAEGRVDYSETLLYTPFFGQTRQCYRPLNVIESAEISNKLYYRYIHVQQVYL